MYPAIYCDVCGRNLSNERRILEEMRLKIADKIDASEEYQLFGDTIDFPMDKVIKDLELIYCCTVTLMGKRDNTSEIYGRAPIPL